MQHFYYLFTFFVSIVDFHTDAHMSNALVIAGIMSLRILVDVKRRTVLVHPDQVYDDAVSIWQHLTGHGCYRADLYKHGHDVDETCPT